MSYLDPGYGEFVVVDGNIVERKMLYLVEKIKDYDPNLEVVCLDPDRADNPFEEPFLICERRGDQLLKIFGVWELNDSVLERIYLADSKRTDVLASIDKRNREVKAESDRRYREKREANQDIVATAIKAFNSEANSFSFTRPEDDAKVTLYDDRPPKVEV